jgi:hypothetical protein
VEQPQQEVYAMDDLDKLAADFVAGGLQPDGAQLGDPGAAPHHHGDHPPTPTDSHGNTVRRFEHRGHAVTIVTHYEVTIDGKPWERHLGVLNNGSVVYHGLPQYAVPSAVDLIRTVIDYQEDTPEDLRAAFRAAQEEG